MSRSVRQRLQLWLPVVAYMALVFALSSLPAHRLSPPGSDKLLHLVEYAVLAVLLLRALAQGLTSATPTLGALAALAASLYGVSDELHQAFVPGRHASLGDLAADAAGASLASVLVVLLVQRRSRAKP